MMAKKGWRQYTTLLPFGQQNRVHWPRFGVRRQKASGDGAVDRAADPSKAAARSIEIQE